MDTYLYEYIFGYDIQEFVSILLLWIPNEHTLNTLHLQILPLVKWNSSPSSGPKNSEIGHIWFVPKECLEGVFPFMEE